MKTAGKESLKDLSKAEIRQLAREIMKSSAPGVRKFLARLGPRATATLNGLIDTIDIGVVLTVGVEQTTNLMKCAQIDCGGHEVY